MSPFTVLVTARNAAPTIGRALASALAQDPSAIILVDDASDDDTVEVALAHGGPSLEIVPLETARSVGFCRQAALERVKTPFAVWLDADDEMLPGRCARLLSRLVAERADIAADSVEIIEERTGRSLGASRLPSFLFEPPGVARLFERNYLPAPGPVAFRADTLRPIGYDPQLHGAEDIDVLLRAITAGARFALVDDIGYRLHTSPRSLSRDLANQRAMLRRALAKHVYETVERLYFEHGASAYVTRWGLVWFATFRGEWQRALDMLDGLRDVPVDAMTIVEPDGPCPRPEAWRVRFQRGTLLLMLGRTAEACDSLAAAEAVTPTPEGANNLGITHYRLGGEVAARASFEAALARWPAFADARANLSAERPSRVTTHPLRAQPARTDYPELEAMLLAP